MFRVIKLGDHEVEMLATASTDLYYKQIFGIDPLHEQTQTGFEAADMVGLIQRMGFVMAKQAELKDRKAMVALNEDSYIEWLDQFDRADILDNIALIRALYNGNKVPTSTEKKRHDQQ